MSLLDYITLEDPDGVEVDLQVDGYRHIEKLDGIQGLTARTSVRPRPSQHGSVSSTRFRDDRVITANGLFLGDDGDRAWLEYHAVSRALAGAVDIDRLLRYGIGGLDLQMLVRCEDVQAPIQVTSRTVATQYALRATDPRAYSQTPAVVTSSGPLSGGGGGLVMPFTFPFTFGALSGGVVSAVNQGTVDTPAVLTLTGYLLNPTVMLGSRQLVFSGEVANGDELVIDLGTREVSLNGSSGAFLVDFSQTTWFEIPPGTWPIELFAASSDASASISVALSDAYQ